MENVTFMNLIQATSGLAGRKNTQLLANGYPVAEIRISQQDGVPYVNLVDAAYSVSIIDDSDEHPKDHSDAVSRMTILSSSLFAVKFFSRWESKRIEFALRILLDKPELAVTKCRSELVDPLDLGKGSRIYAYAQYGAATLAILLQIGGVSEDGRQARYNFALLNLESQNEFGKAYTEENGFPDSYVIFISDEDVLKTGKAVCHFESYVLPMGIQFDDGTHILYVNASIMENTPIGALMHDFNTADPDEMTHPYMADEMRKAKK